MSKLIQTLQPKQDSDNELTEYCKTPYYTDVKIEALVNQKRVLIIDDNKDIIKLLSSIIMDIEYITSKRKNALMISIPMEDHFILISTEPNTNAENIKQKIWELLKDICNNIKN